MQKKLCLMVLILLVCNALFAQEENWNWNDDPIMNRDKSYRIEIGPKVGIGMALGTNPTVFDLDIQNGMAYHFGASANIHFGRRRTQSPGGTGLFGIEAEALYGIRSIGTQAGRMTMRCMEFPLLVQFYPIPSLAIEAGPTFVKTMKCTPDQLQFESIVLNTGLLSGSDVMLTFGACYKAPFKLMIDFRYNLGTSNLAGNFDTKVSSLIFSIAYLFSLIN